MIRLYVKTNKQTNKQLTTNKKEETRKKNKRKKNKKLHIENYFVLSVSP